MRCNTYCEKCGEPHHGMPFHWEDDEIGFPWRWKKKQICNLFVGDMFVAYVEKCAKYWQWSVLTGPRPGGIEGVCGSKEDAKKAVEKLFGLV